MPGLKPRRIEGQQQEEVFEIVDRQLEPEDQQSGTVNLWEQGFEDQYQDQDLLPIGRMRGKKGKPAEVRQIIIAPTDEMVLGTRPEAILLKWHLRGAHINPNYLKQISRHVLGMEELWNIPSDTTLPPCTACIRARTKRKPLPKLTFRRTNIRMFRLHIDLTGRLKPSHEGHRYLILYLDEASNYKWVDAVISNNAEAIIDSLDRLVIQVGCAPTIIRTDRAGEFAGLKMRDYCRGKRIRQEFAVPHEHWMNPRAESAIGTVSVRSRALLGFGNTPRGYWNNAAQYAVEIDNRFTPTSRSSNITPFEAFNGRQPDNSKIRIFGCFAWVWVESCLLYTSDAADE